MMSMDMRKAFDIIDSTINKYADDILLYAKSLDELTSMTEGLMESLQIIRLFLNTKKTKIMQYNLSEEQFDNSFNRNW